MRQVTLALLALVGLAGFHHPAIAQAQGSPPSEAKTVDEPQGSPPSEVKTVDEPQGSPPPEVKTAHEPRGGIELPVFTPPPRGAPRMRVGGGTRQPFLADAPEMYALVPREPGLTIEAQPVLYWWLSKETDARMEFTLVEVRSGEPLIDATLEGRFEPGFQALSLADLHVRLDVGKTYQWSMTYLTGPEGTASDIAAGGGIERVDPSEALRSALATASPTRIPLVLAAAGIWYEAISDLSARIEASPRDARLREERAALLDQVGLETLALEDRRAAGLPDDHGP
jgi:hypothetical protein